MIRVKRRESKPDTPHDQRATSVPGQEFLLEAQGLSFSYGPLQAVRDVSLAVRAQESVAIVGSNGAGKTTLLGVIAGLLRADEGSHFIGARKMDDVGMRRHMQLGTVLVPEGRRVLSRLTVRDNLLLGASCHSWRRPASSDLEFAHDIFPELVDLQSRRAGSLSGGQQQMLAIGRALVSKPTLLLLDEPAQGLAPVVLERLVGSFANLRTSGLTLVVVEQNLSFARQCTDRVYALTQGAIRFDGDWETFARNQHLVEEYL